MIMDYPNVRANVLCPLCFGGKEKDLLVCWSCYREHRLRDGNPEAEQFIKSAEDNLVRQLDCASTMRGEVHSADNTI